MIDEVLLALLLALLLQPVLRPVLRRHWDTAEWGIPLLAYALLLLVFLDLVLS